MTEPATGVVRSAIPVRERDLDNFLLEELRASRSFRQWFLDHLEHCLDTPDYDEIAVGKNPQREVAPGQTDLSLVMLDRDGAQMVRILIESKVASGFQPGQPERYAQEVEAARKSLGRRRAAAVVIAPAANVGVLDNRCFDASIRLEQVLAHLQERQKGLAMTKDSSSIELMTRLAARMDLIDALINKRSYNGNWTPTPIPERLDFIAQYRALASKIVPRFKTTNSTGGWKAKTILFTVPPIRGLPIRNIRHDFRSGVSLVLTNSARVKIAIEKSGLLPIGAITDETPAGTLLIRLPTEPLDPTGDLFQQQMAAVEEGIRAAIRLYDWAIGNAQRLSTLIAGQ